MDRRTFVQMSGASLAAGRGLGRRSLVSAPALPLPSASQLAWQRDELAMFLHFGVNTFTDREWGDGRESPTIFDPARLDARQWARTARAAGFRAMVLTAKHHDGFCLWPTATTRHSVVSSPWRGGSGDVVREFVDACRAEGLRAGLYLSPWDRNHPSYGDSPAYNDVYATQLTELLTRYGSIAEVWFDGANGEGPNGRRQVYDWPRVFGLVRRLQPEAVIFSDAGPDVRWCGNERGVAGDPNWSTVDPKVVSHPGQSGAGVEDALQHGHEAGAVWRPAEVDVSIRPGWFYHPAQDSAVRDVDNLVQLYFTSVGRNAKLLLNVPPTRDGVIHDVDVARLLGFRTRRDQLFGNPLPLRRIEFRPPAAGGARVEWELRRPASPRIARLSEDITRGQRVASYHLEGSQGGRWQTLASGTTIGHAKLDRLVDSPVFRRLRLVIDEWIATPEPVAIQLFDQV
ncbi:MAG TPA: alpha-L-fucosidase [Aeromicrobium sp.]|nr:alpha-L-fucosidase [Aeromicrobium sp.]